MTTFKFKFSSKKDGPTNLVGHPEIDSERLKNRTEFLLSSELKLYNYNTVIPKLQHGSAIEVVDQSNYLGDYGSMKAVELRCDGLITTKKGLALTVSAGDCYPVFIYDPVQEVICLLHCGWRGLAKEIVSKAVSTLKNDFGASSDNLLMEIGPGICKKCYEVGQDVLSLFGDNSGLNGHFDLKAEIRNQSGLTDRQILDHNICTYEHDEYFSYRRDGKINGVLNIQMAVAIMI